MPITFQYSVLLPNGALVTTTPTLRDALDRAKQYKGIVMKKGVVIYRAKSSVNGGTK